MLAATMSDETPPLPPNAVRPRIRVYRGAEIALGPGKVNLLEMIASAGTLAEAARRLGMSYMRAWKLLQTMNTAFRAPLVDTSRGGSEHGHASLTATGHAVLVLYRRMEAESRRAIEPAWREMERLLAE
jgi:molybdate transport system regulatory protein